MYIYVYVMRMYIKRKNVQLINHDFLPILMLLYIMLACLMLFADFSNAVCLYNALFSFFSLNFANVFLSCFVLVY